MNKIDKINYWITSSNKDWIVAGHLLEKDDYPYCLFFGHLALEKMLKAIFVFVKNEVPPLTHRLVYLAEKTGLDFTDAQIELLEVVTDFNLEARYPDEKFSFHKKCTREFTVMYLKQIEEIKKWLLQRMPSSEISEDI